MNEPRCGYLDECLISKGWCERHHRVPQSLRDAEAEYSRKYAAEQAVIDAARAWVEDYAANPDDLTPMCRISLDLIDSGRALDGGAEAELRICTENRNTRF